MIEQLDIHQIPSFFDLLGNLCIRFRRIQISGRMIMTMIPDALALIAYCNIILTSVTVPLIPPFDIDAIPSTLFDLVNSINLNSSICFIESLFQLSINISNASFEHLTCNLSEALTLVL